MGSDVLLKHTIHALNTIHVSSEAADIRHLSKKLLVPGVHPFMGRMVPGSTDHGHL